MYEGNTVAVVVPAYNEEKQIRRVIDTMPGFVDRIIIVNDGSRDRTSEIVRQRIAAGCAGVEIKKDLPLPEDYGDDPYRYADKVLAQSRLDEMQYYTPHQIYNDNDVDRIVLIDQTNAKKGAALSNGYRWCREHAIDCVATMDGDGQMDPTELESLVRPVACEGIDFVKGNRLMHPSAEVVIPSLRRFGNSVLSILTKIASGYWSVSDSQTGYICMSARAINGIPLHKLYRDYGCPNDLMVKLNIANCTIREVMIRPVYNVGEQSKMKISKVIPRISLLLLSLFFHRITVKYFKRGFHPLFLFYMMGILLLFAVVGMLIYALYTFFSPDRVVTETVYISILLGIVFVVQSFGFAMFMDIQDNQTLYK